MNITKQIPNYDEITTLPPGAMFLVDPANNGQYKRISKANAAISFGNGPGDLLAPVVLSLVAMSAGVIRATFNEPMQDANLLGWMFDNGSPQFPTGVAAVSSTVWDFAVSGLAPGQTIRASHNNAVTQTMDLAGNKLSTFNNVTVTNSLSGGGGGGDTTPPVLVGAVINNGAPSTPQLTFDEAIPTYAASGVSFLKNGLNWPIVSVSSPATAVLQFTMSTPAAPGDTITVSYNPAVGGILNAAGLELGVLTNEPVDNNLAGGTYHPAAQALFDANSAILTGQKAAYNTFFQYLDDNLANGLADIDAMWGFLFGSAADNKWNWVDPVDNDANHRAVFNGGVTHGSNFIQSNGSTGYVDLKFNPSSVFSAGNYCVLADYFDEDGSSANGGIVGNIDPSENTGLMIFPYLSSSIWGFGVSTFKNTAAPGTPYAATVQVSRLSATNFSVYINGDAALTESASDTTAIPAGNAFALALNKEGSGVVRFTTCKLRFVIYARNVDSSAASHLRVAITNLKTALGI